MSEQAIAFAQMLWANPLYRGLLIAIGAEIALVGALIGWLWGQSALQLRRDWAHQRFLDQMEAPFFDALGDPDKLDQWMRRAQSCRREFVRDFVADYVAGATERRHETLVELYHGFGYADDDHADIRSASAGRRLQALRRLYVVGTARDRAVLVEQVDADYLSRMIAAQTLGRVGQPDDILAIFDHLELRTHLMDQPVYAVLDALSDDQVRFVFTRWRQFGCPRVRRIVLQVAAGRHLAEVAPALAEAVGSDDLEVRVGACAAAADLADQASADMLLARLDDPAWQVRARSAKALGARRESAAVDGLADALTDRAFWVRQDAAGALAALGPAGLDRLRDVHARSDDRYAAETAGQELQRQQFLAQPLGGTP